MWEMCQARGQRPHVTYRVLLVQCHAVLRNDHLEALPGLRGIIQCVGYLHRMQGLGTLSPVFPMVHVVGWGLGRPIVPALGSYEACIQ
jgi:hypothetical protein